MINPTLPIAKHLKRLAASRQSSDQSAWLEEVVRLGKQAQLLLDRQPQAGRPASQGLSKNGVIYSGSKGYGRSLKVIEFCQKFGIILKPKENWWYLERAESSSRLPQKRTVDRLMAIANRTPSEEQLLAKAKVALAIALKEVKPLLPRTGYIHGLDNSRGWPRITNGIDVWIERADGTCFKGHRDWLRWDKRPRDLTRQAASEAGTPKHDKPAKGGLPAAYVAKAKEIVEAGDARIDEFAEKYYARVGEPPMLMLDSVAESIDSIAKAIARFMEGAIQV